MNIKEIKISKKSVYILSLLFLFTAATFAVKGILLSAPTLSEERILELRTQYPLYDENPPFVFAKEPKLEEVLKTVDAVILGEVTEVLPEYSVELITDSDTPEGKIYEKAKQYGMTNTASFIQYRVKVFRDISGISSVESKDIEDDIIISVNSELEGYIPELKPGMKIITPIKKGAGKHEGKYFFSKYGFYYVTEEGYVLSAYVEDGNAEFTGKTLDYLEGKLKEIAAVK